MRPFFTLFAGAAILFCSCSSSHKIQNGEDPGYSSRSSRSAGQNDYYSTAPSDNYVRMKTTDDPRWSQFDDNNSYDNYYAAPMAASPYYGFGYSPYAYGYGMYGMYGYSAMSIGFGFWDPYFGWNSYFAWNLGYNPYFCNPYYGGGVLIVQQPGYNSPGTNPSTGVSQVYSHLNAFNASTYRGGNFAASARNGRSFGNGRSTFSSRSSFNSGSVRTFSNTSNSTPRTSNPPSFTPRSTGGNSGGGFFGGGSSSGGRSFPSGGGGGNSGVGGGGSFGGRGGFRH